MNEERVGKVKHFYPEPQAALIALGGRIRKGEMVHIKGTDTDIVDRVESLQIGERQVDEASGGDEVGLKVREPVHENSEVFVLRE